MHQKLWHFASVVFFVLPASTQAQIEYNCKRLVQEKPRCRIYNYNHPLCKKWDTSLCPPPRIIRQRSQCVSYTCSPTSVAGGGGTEKAYSATPLTTTTAAPVTTVDYKEQQEESQESNNELIRLLREQILLLKKLHREKDTKINSRLEDIEKQLRVDRAEKNNILSKLRAIRQDIQTLAADPEKIVRQEELSKLESRLQRQIEQIELDQRTYKKQHDTFLTRANFSLVHSDLTGKVNDLKVSQQRHQVELGNVQEKLRQLGVPPLRAAPRHSQHDVIF